MKTVSVRRTVEEHTMDNSNDHLNGACIIDAQGHEIPITEAMIKEALEKIDESWSTYRHS